MEIGVATDVGRVRELNEDTVLARTLLPGVGNPWRLTAVLLVADGLGGHQAGEVASQLAGETIRQLFVLGQTEHWVPDAVTPEAVREWISGAIQQINQLVHQQSAGAAGTARPATTLTLCLCRDGEYHIGHVGDTRAYLIRGEGIQQITEDDSWVGEAVRRGQMTEHEAQASPFRNQLLKTVGTAASVEPSLYSGEIRTDDVLMLCSDGLTEYVSPEEMRQQMASQPTLQQASAHLVALARERGGHDNISLVCTSPRVRVARTCKPPTLPRGDRKPATWPPVGLSRTTPDPNHHLRFVLLALVGLAALMMGLWFGRHLSHRAGERGSKNPFIVAPAAVPSVDVAPTPTVNKIETGRHTGRSRRHPPTR